MFKFIKLTQFSLVLIDVSPYPLYSFGKSLFLLDLDKSSKNRVSE